MSDNFLCPKPQKWNEIYQKLRVARDTSKESTIPQPPIPLILAGWWASTNKDKHERWAQTLEWAKRYGFSELIPVLSADDSYFE